VGLGAPWPEVRTSGASPVVLEPVVGETGVGRWQGGSLTCLIGELRQLFGSMLVRS